MTNLTCSLVSDDAALERWVPAWTDLLAQSSSNEPTLSPGWQRAWWRIFGGSGGRRLRVALFLEGDRLVGLVPLLLRRHWYRRAIPFRRLEMLGSGESLADEIVSEYLNVVALRGAEERVVRALAAALLHGPLVGWDEFVLQRMDGWGPIPRLLSEELGRAGVQASVSEVSSAAYIPLPGSWDAYLGQLSSSRRYHITRSLRDFEQWADGTAAIHRVTTPRELAEGMQVLRSLHGERWSADRPGGAFASPRFAAFHDAVAPELLASGALDLSWLSAHGQPVAALYNIVHGGKVSFYQCGRKLGLPPKVRVGIVVHAHGIRRAIEAGLREYDFLAGGLHYKQRLALATRPLVELRAARRPVLESMRLLADRGFGHAVALRDMIRGRERQEGDEAPPPNEELGS